MIRQWLMSLINFLIRPRNKFTSILIIISYGLLVIEFSFYISYIYNHTLIQGSMLFKIDSPFMLLMTAVLYLKFKIIRESIYFTLVTCVISWLICLSVFLIINNCTFNPTYKTKTFNIIEYGEEHIGKSSGGYDVPAVLLKIDKQDIWLQLRKNEYSRSRETKQVEIEFKEGNLGYSIIKKFDLINGKG
jgi:hypothetical protein